MNTYIEISYEDWVDKYKPILDEDTGALKDFWEVSTEAALAVKKAATERRLWTLLDGEVTFISSGWHFVNRLAYYITEVPYEEGVDIEIEY